MSYKTYCQHCGQDTTYDEGTHYCALKERAEKGESVIITPDKFDALSKQVQLMASEVERMSARQQAQGEIIKSMALKHNSLANTVQAMAKMNADLLEKLQEKMEDMEK